MNNYIFTVFLCVTLFSGAYSEGLQITGTNVNNGEVTTIPGPGTYTFRYGDTVDFNCAVPSLDADRPLPPFQTIYWLVCRRTVNNRLASTQYCYESNPNPINSNHMTITFRNETGNPIIRTLECIWRNRATGQTKQIKITVRGTEDKE